MTSKTVKTYKGYPLIISATNARGKWDYKTTVQSFSESQTYTVPMLDYDGLQTSYSTPEIGASYYSLSTTALPDYSSSSSTTQCLMESGTEYENIQYLKSNLTLSGVTLSDANILSGFSTSAYPKLDSAFPDTITQFKMIMKAHTGTDIASKQNVLLSPVRSDGYYMYAVYQSKFTLYKGSWVYGSNTLSTGTDYWFKIELVDGSYIGYTAEDNGYTIDNVESNATWRQEWSDSTDFISSYVGAIGNNPRETGDYWSGTIDIGNSSITCNDEEYLGTTLATYDPMQGLFYNYTDDGSEQTLNCFYDGSKYLLSPDYSIGSYTYLGTVTIPEHDLWKYDDGTWTKQYRTFVWRDIDDDGNLTLATGEFPADTFKGVTKIDTGALNSAFSGCTGLTGSVTFPDLVEVGNSGLSSAFSGCSGLTSAYFPLLTTVGDYGLYGMFEDCTSLTEIHFSASAESAIKSADGYDENFGATNATIYFDL